jgi:dephospho-CoA kinase
MQPLKIGITGGIGSGKSIICKIFHELGVPIYYADEEAKKLVKEHPEIKNEIVKEFGSDTYSASGELERTKLSEIVFKNPDLLKKLNLIIHPRVKQHFLDWSAQFEDLPYVIKEAAIIFESGSYKHLDKVIMVYAPEELRIRRVLQREGMSEESIRERMKNQISEEEKIKKSDFIIYNDETRLIVPQILDLHQKINLLAKSYSS